MGLKLETAPLSLQKAVLAALAKEPVKEVVVKPKKNKFKAVRTQVNGIWFASKGEAKRYTTLKQWEDVGAISGLELQPKYPYFVGSKKVFTYKADFRYKNHQGEVIEDFKGFATPVYKLKKKIIEAHYGIIIHEVR